MRCIPRRDRESRMPKVILVGEEGKRKGDTVMAYNWAPIKTEYVTGTATLKALAKKYGVGIQQTNMHSRTEHWVEQRKAYRARCVEKATQKAEDKEANRLARLMNATNRAIDVALGAFTDEEQFHRYIISEGIGGGATETTERIFAKVDTKALRDLSAVLKELTGLMRDFYNMPTPAQAEAQRIAAERLELDKKKAETGESLDTEVIVRFATEDADDYSK